MNYVPGFAPHDYSLPTVKIVNDDMPEGFVIINRSEYNSEIHKLYVQPASGVKKS